MTVRVGSGDAARWTALREIRVVDDPAISHAGRLYGVQRARSYRDRLILKLRDIENANEASALRGKWIVALRGEVPVLPEGTYYVARLMGLRVVDEQSGEIGTVAEVLATGGVDILVVQGGPGGEVLIPLAREVVVEVQEAQGIVRVQLPEGLAGLNRKKGSRA